MASLSTAHPVAQRGLNSAIHAMAPTNCAPESNRRRLPASNLGVTSAKIASTHAIARNRRCSCASEDRSSDVKIKSHCLLALVAFALLQCSTCLDLVRILPPDNSKMRSVRTANLPFKITGMPLYLKGGSPALDHLGESERVPRPSTFLRVRTLSFDSSDQPWPKSTTYPGKPSAHRDWLMKNSQSRRCRPPKLSRCVERN